MVKSLIAPVLIVCLSVHAKAQDRIYFLKNKTEDRIITQIDPGFIKAVDAQNPEIAYSITPSNVLFSFNSKGNFIVLPTLYRNQERAKKHIGNFLNPPQGSFAAFDKIITLKNHIILCHYVSDDGKQIRYIVKGDTSAIAVSNVALLVFKDGSHLIKAGIDKTFKVLSAVEDLYLDLATRNQDMEEGPGKNGQAGSDSNNPRTGDSGASAARGNVLEPDSGTMTRLQQKALINIKQLGDYIQMISMKETGPEEVIRTIDQAMTLFVPEATIEVSSVNSANIYHYPVKTYLNRIGALKYDKVIIEWYKIMYATSFRKGPDGNYYATINFEQRFVGTRNEKTVYEDITRKSVEIVLKTYERNTGGVTRLEWDVFLGDISVTVTKPA